MVDVPHGAAVILVIFEDVVHDGAIRVIPIASIVFVMHWIKRSQTSSFFEAVGCEVEGAAVLGHRAYHVLWGAVRDLCADLKGNLNVCP